MKKALIAVAVLVAVGAGGTYWVGEYSQQKTTDFIAQNNQLNNGFVAKLISYDKSFLQAKSQVELTFEHPELPDQQWKLLVDANIRHWPYKAVIDSTFTAADPETKAIVEPLFGTLSPLTSHDEVSLFGQLDGKAKLKPIKLIDGNNAVTMTPATMTYSMDLNDLSGKSGIELASLDIKGDESFSLNDIKIGGKFAQLADSQVMTYDYKFEFKDAQVKTSDINLAVTGAAMRSSLLAGKKANTLDVLMALNVSNYVLMAEQEQELAFTDSAFEINIKGLDQHSITELSRLQANPDQMNQELAQQLLLDLVAKGANISVPKLTSQTPWGKINADLTIDLPEGAIDQSIMVNGPQAGLAQLTGSANARVSKRLLEAPGIGDQLNFAMMMGILAEEGEELVLTGTLDKGELIVNGKSFPTM